MLARTAHALVAALVLAGASALADLHVVDASGAGDFTSIEAAVQAASDGDVILVRPGTYGYFLMLEKGLTVVAEQPNSVFVSGGTRVAYLAPGQRALLSNLVLFGNPSATLFANHGLSVGNAGAVRIENCRFLGASQHEASSCGQPAKAGGKGIHVVDSSDVALTSCVAEGGIGLRFVASLFCVGAVGGDGGDALHAVDSHVVAHFTRFDGGRGGAAAHGGTGGAGVRTLGGQVVLSNCVPTGGNGGNLEDAFGFGTYGIGGPGVHAAGPWVSHETFPAGGTSPGGDGSDVAGLPPTTWPEHYRALDVTPVVREGAPAMITVWGKPHDLAFLLLGHAPAHVPLAAHSGVLLNHPFDVLPLGVLPAFPLTAKLQVPLVMPALPPGLDAAVLSAQAAVFSTSGDAWLTNGRHLVVIPSDA